MWVLLLFSVSVSSWVFSGSLEGGLNTTELKQALLDLERNYTVSVSSAELQRTFRCLPIPLLTISDSSHAAKRKILLVAGFSAENPAPISFLFSAIHRVLSDPSLFYLLKSLELTYIPVLNWDAYTDQTNYYAVKSTLLPFTNNRNGTGCATEYFPFSPLNGVNLNRNFDFQWQQKQNCSHEFSGAEPFSETETLALKNIFEIQDFSLVLDFDGTENQYIFPFMSYREIQTKNYRNSQDIFAFRSLENNTNFPKNHIKIGTLAEISNKTNSGEFIDWAYKKGVFSYKIGIKQSQSDQNSIFSSHFSAFKAVLDNITPLYSE